MWIDDEIWVILIGRMTTLHEPPLPLRLPYFPLYEQAIYRDDGIQLFAMEGDALITPDGAF